MDIWVASLRSDMALYYLTGSPSIILASSLDGYKGRILFHVAAYESREDEQEAYTRIIEEGWSPEDFPTNSFVGWAKIVENKEYNNVNFAQDVMFHGYTSNDLNVFKANQGWHEPVFGLKIADLNILSLPIMGINGKYQHGDWWQPESPLEQLAAKRALEGKTVQVDQILSKPNS